MGIRRRLLVGLASGGALAPFSGFAQVALGRVWRVSVLEPFFKSAVNSTRFEAFFAGMREQGLIEGKNLAYDWHFADGDYQTKLPQVVRELLAGKPDVIFVIQAACTLALARATRTIPIVFTAVPDPVGIGIASSLGKPGANLTGITNTSTDLGVKYLELLRAVMPDIARAAVLVNPSNPAHKSDLNQVKQAAATLSIDVTVYEATTIGQVAEAFQAMNRAKTRALVVTADATFYNLAKDFQKLIDQYRIPVIYSRRDQVVAGGLLSYGSSLDDDFRRATVYISKVLNGAKPGDLPIERPSRYYLVLNRKTANTLGLKFPQQLLVRADEVIE
jgi:putative ABC transport system substrate-binding protein